MPTKNTVTPTKNIMMPGNPSIMTYKCESWASDFQARFLKCGEFLSGVDDNGIISIWLRHTSTTSSCVGGRVRVHRDVEVLLKKTNLTPVRVHINLKIRESDSWAAEQTQVLDAWKESCFFPDFCFNSYSSDTKYKIDLQINWNMMDTTPDKVPNPYLEMSDFLMTSDLSDVTISIGGERISGHKLILSAASTVFRAMLMSPMKEKEENCIVIEDIEADVMKIVLKILYTGQDDDLNNVETAWDTLAVAEKYDMKKLKQQCEHKLLENLNVHNALRTLDEADTYRAETLKMESMRFIICHQKEIIGMEDFGQLFMKKPSLMMQFTVGIVNSKSEVCSRMGV